MASRTEVKLKAHPTDIKLKVTGKSERAITVNYEIIDGTATDGDYNDTTNNGVATIAAEATGNNAGTIAIATVSESPAMSEGNEMFMVRITSVSGARIDANGLRPITVTITEALPTLTVSCTRKRSFRRSWYGFNRSYSSTSDRNSSYSNLYNCYGNSRSVRFCKSYK